MSYATGHVKRNPDTGEVALRRHFPDDDPDFVAVAWAVVAPRVGARSAATAEVDGWTDLFIPDSEGGS